MTTTLTYELVGGPACGKAGDIGPCPCPECEAGESLPPAFLLYPEPRFTFPEMLRHMADALQAAADGREPPPPLPVAVHRYALREVAGGTALYDYAGEMSP